MMTDGPVAITHGHVAEAANVSRTTVYKHYPTRGDLLRATIEHVGRPFPADLTGDFATDLRSFVADVADDLGNDEHARAFITLMERAQHDPEIAAVRDDLVCDAEDQFRTMVLDAVATETEAARQKAGLPQGGKGQAGMPSGIAGGPRAGGPTRQSPMA